MALPKVFRILFLLAFTLGILAFPQARAERSLPVFDFDTLDDARAAWIPASGVNPVELDEGLPGQAQSGVRFPCNFSDVASRCYWDRTIAEDFTHESLITLRIFIEDPMPISSLTLYFRSGAGWYHNTFGNLQRGWQDLRCARANFNTSGTPTGWHAIDGIRFSPWKATDQDTEIVATELRLLNPKILVVRGTKSTSQDTADSTTDRISAALDAWGIDFSVVTEENVEDGALDGAHLAIFPYSNNMSDVEVAQIEHFVESGGKIIVFFTAPPEIFHLLGIENLGSAGFAPSAMRFRTDLVDCIPSFIPQASWNFFKVRPVEPDVQVLAEWEDPDGTSLEWPAWTIGTHGAYMSHILLSDSWEEKKRLMLALATHFVPEIEEGVAEYSLDAIGRVGPYQEFDEAVAEIRSKAEGSPRTTLVEEHLANATSKRDAALDAPATGTLCETLELIFDARDHLLEAFFLAQTPRQPEFRAVWASYNSTAGPYVDGWDIMASDLAKNGFNAVMPFLATGGVAYFNSSYLPHAEVFDLRGDHIAACVAACKPLGVETHVRKLNWFLYHTPQSFIDEMRAQSRTQVDVDGEPIDYLCPSHPLNYELEMNVMLEMIDHYDIDGIHYDFIRYPNERSCYCDGCHERFQNDSGLEIEDWPTDCYSGVHKEAYREWRREQITRLVRSMREAVDARGKPVKISAAVFSNSHSARTSVAQDWVAWIEQGYIDFICPMNYTNSLPRFEALIEEQTTLMAGRAPVYPGVGVASGRSSLTADQTIAQLLITRQMDTEGFVLFVYNSALAESILPHLRKGLTAESPPTLWQLR